MPSHTLRTTVQVGFDPTPEQVRAALAEDAADRLKATLDQLEQENDRATRR